VPALVPKRLAPPPPRTWSEKSTWIEDRPGPVMRAASQELDPVELAASHLVSVAALVLRTYRHDRALADHVTVGSRDDVPERPRRRLRGGTSSQPSPTVSPHQDPGRPEIAAHRLPPNAGRLLDALRGPPQTAQGSDLLLLLVL